MLPERKNPKKLKITALLQVDNKFVHSLDSNKIILAS